MRREAAIDEALPIRGLLRVAAEFEDIFPAPAETGGADGEVGAFGGTEGVEEGVDTRARHGETVTVHKGEEAVKRVCEGYARAHLPISTRYL